jgi:hypothetical protein
VVSDAVLSISISLVTKSDLSFFYFTTSEYFPSVWPSQARYTNITKSSQKYISTKRVQQNNDHTFSYMQ